MKKTTALALTVFGLLLNLLSFRAGHDWGDDYAGYVLQAQAVAQGDFEGLKRHIRDTDFILNYPWGFPVLLAPVIHLFDARLKSLKAYVYIFFILAVAVFYLLFKPDEGDAAAAGAAFLAVSPYFWEFKNSLLADLPNLFFTGLALLVMRSIVVRKRVFLTPALSDVLLGTVIFLAYAMRNQSIVLLPTLLLMQLLAGRAAFSKSASIRRTVSPYLVFAVLAVGLARLIPIPSTPYLEQYQFDLPFLVRTVIRNTGYYASVWRELYQALPIVHRTATAAALLSLIPAAAGALRSLKKDKLPVVFFSLTLGLFLITPFHQGLRYVLPLVPFYVFFLLSGLNAILSSARSRLGSNVYRVGLALFLALSSLTVAVRTYGILRSPGLESGPYAPASREMFSFISANAGQDEKVVFFKPRAMLLHGGRDGRVAATAQDCLAPGIGFVVVARDADSPQVPLAALQERPEAFAPVFRNGDFTVFRVQRR